MLSLRAGQSTPSAAAASLCPIRVCLVGPSLDILGGQAVQLDRLRTLLGDLPDLELSFLPVNPRLPGKLRRLQEIKYVRTLVTSAAYVLGLLGRLRKCDVVHVFSASYFSFVLAPTPAILVAKLFGKKVILNYRSGEAEDHLRRSPRVAIPVIRLADEIVVPSGYLVEIFGRFGLRARSIFNVVDVDRFRFRRRDPLRPVFFANRNFEPLYNVACILKAFALIQQRHPDARLIIAGDGSQRASLQALATELELRSVEWCGRVEPGRMAELYDAADVYLNSSNIDNMPSSIIEAYAAGLPVVTTDAGGIAYILSHERTGLMVACDDHHALAAQALRLLGDPRLAAEIADRAHHECHSLYGGTAVREEWVRLYTDVGRSAARTTGTGERRHLAKRHIGCG